MALEKGIDKLVQEFIAQDDLPRESRVLMTGEAGMSPAQRWPGKQKRESRLKRLFLRI